MWQNMAHEWSLVRLHSKLLPHLFLFILPQLLLGLCFMCMEKKVQCNSIYASEEGLFKTYRTHKILEKRSQWQWDAVGAGVWNILRPPEALQHYDNVQLLLLLLLRPQEVFISHKHMFVLDTWNYRCCHFSCEDSPSDEYFTTRAKKLCSSP